MISENDKPKDNRQTNSSYQKMLIKYSSISHTPAWLFWSMKCQIDSAKHELISGKSTKAARSTTATMARRLFAMLRTGESSPCFIASNPFRWAKSRQIVAWSEV